MRVKRSTRRVAAPVPVYALFDTAGEPELAFGGSVPFVLSEKFVTSITSVFAPHRPRASSLPLPDGAPTVPSTVERDDTSAGHHLVLDGDVGRRLKDVIRVVVRRRNHRARQPARDAAISRVEVLGAAVWALSDAAGDDRHGFARCSQRRQLA